MSKLSSNLRNAFQSLHAADAQELLDAIKPLLSDASDEAQEAVDVILKEADARIWMEDNTPLAPLLKDVIAAANEYFTSVGYCNN